MLIVCPNCSTSYRIELSSLGTSGRSVRCAKCKTVWFATADDVVATAVGVPQPPAPPPPAPRAADTDFGAIDPGWGLEAESPAAREAEPFSGSMPVADSPSLVPDQDQVPIDAAMVAAAGEPAPREDIETIAARRARRAQAARTRKRLVLAMPSAPVLILVLAAVLAGLVAARVSVVRTFPQTASLYAAIGLPVNLRGLAFENVRSESETHEGVQVLVIEGTIVNVAGRAVDVPRLRFAVRNPAGYEVYAWTALPGRTRLGAGEVLPFRTRLASPPADARDIVARFFNRRDAVAGTR